MVDKFFSILLDGEETLNPIYEGISNVGPIAISAVLGLCLFYGIFIGLKYAKATDASEKANIQQTIINFVIGAVIVIVLLAIIYAIREPLANFIDNG